MVSFLLLFASSVAASPDGAVKVIGQPVALAVHPEAVTLAGPRTSQQIIVTGRYADGSLRDLTPVCDWSADRSELIAIQPHGYVIPIQDGRTTLTVRAGGQSVQMPVTVENAAQAEPISFRREVMGVLSVAGCNDIGCHGAPSGKKGFRLSLWAFDPGADYAQLTRDAFGRRVDRLRPEASLILQKALQQISHEGGQRFRSDSREAHILSGWLSEGTRDEAHQAAAVEVVPGRRVLGAAAPWQQLAVRATSADGGVRDVTRLTVFTSSDPSIATVGPTGLVEFSQSGEVAILCRYLDQLVSVRLTCTKPPERLQWPNPPENNYVDKLVFAKLKLLGIPPSDLCSDREFVRRAYLDVCGVLPTVPESEAFIADAAQNKRARLIDALLDRPEYADYWTQKWIDVLRVSKRAIQLDGAKTYHAWLRDQVQKDTGIDQVVRALLTAQGHSFKEPPANYYCVVREPPGTADAHYLQTDMAETTAQLFLGIRLQCARCHNHPAERWTQEDYNGLAAFFTQVVQKRIGEMPKGGPADTRPVSISLKLKAPDITQTPGGKPVSPRFLGGPAPAFAADRDRREVLAEWLTGPHNPFFARAMVNRLWYHLHGRGIVEPVDDFRESNPPANEELLDALAKDFVAHRFQSKPLLRLILNSRTYQLSARGNEFNKTDGKYFSHVVPKPLPAEVLLDALAAVTGIPEKYPDFPAGLRAVQLPFSDIITLPGQYQEYEQHPFMRVFGQPSRELVCECGRERDFNQAQALEMMIGRTVAAKLRAADNRLGRLLADNRSDADILRELYLVALSRPPAEAAGKAFLDHVARATDKRRAWEDVLWTILRSQEFVYRH